jgi:hypothetical protein
VAKPVYSRNLIAVHAFAGTLNFVVPTDEVHILRDADFYINTIVPTASAFLVDGITGGAFFHAGVTAADIGSPTWVGWRGRQVFGPGTTYTLEVAGDTWDIRVSGYVLTYP